MAIFRALCFKSIIKHNNELYWRKADKKRLVLFTSLVVSSVLLVGCVGLDGIGKDILSNDSIQSEVLQDPLSKEDYENSLSNLLQTITNRSLNSGESIRKY